MKNNKKPLRAGYKSSDFYEKYADVKAPRTQKQRLYLFLCLILLAILVILPMSAIKAKALDFHGIPYDNLPQELTAYHMRLNLDGREGKKYYTNMDIFAGKTKPFARTEQSATAIITFNDIKLKTHAENERFTIMINLDVTVLGYTSMFNTVFFYDNFDTGLTNNHYKELEQMEKALFNNVTMNFYGIKPNQTIINELRFHNFSMSDVLEFYTTQEDKSIVDPDSDNYDSDFGNSGDSGTIDASGKDNSESDTGFFEWLANLFGVSASNLQNVFILAACIFLILFLLPSIVRLITFSKK